MRSLVLAVASLIPVLCSAQPGSVKLGLEFGPTLSSLPGADLSDMGVEYYYLKSYTAGLDVQYDISRHFSLSSGIAYQRKGNYLKIHTGPEPGLNEQIHTLHYLSVPVLAQVSYGKKARYSVFMGPFAAYLADATVRAITKDFDEQSKWENLDKGDFGIQGGLGISLPLNKRISGGVELSNSFGLADIRYYHPGNLGYLRTNCTTLTAKLSYTL